MLRMTVKPSDAFGAVYPQRFPLIPGFLLAIDLAPPCGLVGLSSGTPNRAEEEVEGAGREAKFKSLSNPSYATNSSR